MPGIFPQDCLVDTKSKLEKIIDENRRTIETLLKQPIKTYRNFMRPYMELGERVNVFFVPVSHLQHVKNDEKSQEAFTSCIGLMSSYSTELAHDKRVYEAFIEIRDRTALSDVERKVIDDAIFDFELEGVALPPEGKERVKEINIRLSELSDEFSQNVLNATNAYKIKVADESVLGEMPESDKNAAKCDGGWEFTLQMPSYIAFMTYVTDRKLREEVYRAYSTRAPENSALITEILALRDEKARLLGYNCYADLSIKDMSAPSVKAVMDFLESLVKAGKPFALDELRQMTEFSGLDKLESYDTSFYSNRYKKALYNYDEEALRPYFEQNRVINGLFDILERLFNIEFREKRVKLWNDKARFYELYHSGKLSGGLYLDLEARPEKRGGAWMNNWHTRHIDKEGSLHIPEAFIVANFPVSKPDNPSLLRHDDVSTLFHEMGHALHHLLSQVDELNVSGINGVDWDTVEFPSQFLDNFAYAPEVLDLIAVHYENGEKLPQDLKDKATAAKNFQSGMALVRQLEFAAFDMLIHMKKMDAAEVQQTIDKVRRDMAVIIPPHYNLFQNGFTHIFSGGYAAGYYSYKWAEMLAADAFCAFAEKKIFDRTLAVNYLNNVLARGSSSKMDVIYRDFLGRDPDPASILKLAGLI